MKDAIIKPFNAVIFGGDGDLSTRKIIPAFYHRFVDGQLKMPFRIICITRSLDDETAFKALLTEFIAKTLDEGEELIKIDSFMEHLELMKIPTTTQASFEILKQAIELESNWQRVFYFSVPSSAFGEICKTLKAASLIKKSSKVVLEKPLGNSLKSSQEIN
jgi:glucose-6-phosphate 1-dehydrogenase